MNRAWVRELVLVVCAGAIGWWAHGQRAVEAQSGSNLYFQLHGVTEKSALALYYPGEKAIYIYQGATTGFSTLNCTYKFELGSPGAGVKRKQCLNPGFEP